MPCIDPADLEMLQVRSCVGPLHVQVHRQASIALSLSGALSSLILLVGTRFNESSMVRCT